MADALLVEFNKLNEQLCESFEKNDLKAICDCYTTDCCYMVAGNDVVIGREDVQKAYEDFIKNSDCTKFKVTAVEVIPHGDDWASERGSYTLYNKDGAQTDVGKYVLLRKKQDGKWLMHYDIFNSNKA